MIAAFGPDLRMEILAPRLTRDRTGDALAALSEIAQSQAPVTEELLTQLLERLTGR